jgi:CubicO group peptidase (beta-lactamase class C family)
MPPMAIELKVDTDAEEVGFDAGRLGRIDRHFARYVEEGQLPGWLIVVTRRGRVAHLSRCGHADVEAGRPVEVDTLWRIFSCPGNRLMRSSGSGSSPRSA